MGPFDSGFGEDAGDFGVMSLIVGCFIALIAVSVFVFIIVFIVRAARRGGPGEPDPGTPVDHRRRTMLQNQRMLNDQMSQTNLQNQITQQNLLNDQLNQQNIINQQNNGMP